MAKSEPTMIAQCSFQWGDKHWRKGTVVDDAKMLAHFGTYSDELRAMYVQPKAAKGGTDPDD